MISFQASGFLMEGSGTRKQVEELANRDGFLTAH
jgi:hypothetical protein